MRRQEWQYLCRESQTWRLMRTPTRVQRLMMRVVLLETNTAMQEFRLRRGRRLQSGGNQYAAVPEEFDSDPACEPFVNSQETKA